MKKKHGLLTKLILAMAFGVALGSFAPDWCIRLCNCFGATFGQFIKFIVPFIVIGLVTPAIAEAGRSAGRMLLTTVAVAYCSTICAGFFAFGVSDFVFPRILSGALDTATAVKSFKPYFVLEIPPLTAVTTALAISFIFGLAMVSTGSETLFKTFKEMRVVVTKAIERAFVPLLPLYIFTVIADLTASGRLGVIGGACLKIMAMAMATTVTVLFLQYIIAGMVAGKNPFKALWTMLPAYLTGWGCCSSAATIPVTLRQTKLNGVSEETADLVVPLCANIHLAGSMANMVVYAAGLMVLCGDSLGIGAFAEYIAMISIIAVASPGVPGGVVLASASIAESALGFSPERYALMIAIYMALDGMGTACNLTGDGAIAIVVDRLRKEKETT